MIAHRTDDIANAGLLDLSASYSLLLLLNIQENMPSVNTFTY